MAKIYDIAERLKGANQRPIIKIDEEHEFKVNTSLSAVLFIQNEASGKGKAESNELETMKNIVTIALGKEATEYFDTENYSLEGFTLIVNAIMAGIQGVDLKEIEGEEVAKESNNFQ